jgi:hypothetical protein
LPCIVSRPSSKKKLKGKNSILGANIRSNTPIIILPKHIPNHVISKNIPKAIRANPRIFLIVQKPL